MLLKWEPPFIAVVYEEKMDGFIQLAELNDYSIPLKELDFESLMKKFDLLLKTRTEYSEKLKAKLPGWQKSAEKNNKFIIFNSTKKIK